MDLERDVEAARHGDLAAYGRMVQATQAMVHAVALRILRNEADAQDAAQEIYLRAFRRLGQLDDPATFAGWLRAIAVSVSSNIRRRQRTTFVSLDDGPDVPILDAAEERWTTGQRERLAAAILGLTDEERRLCDRRYHGGWSVGRLASKAGISQPVMAKRLQRMRDKLRVEIEMQERHEAEGAALPQGLPAKIVELLARPRLVDLPENPVGRTLDLIERALPGHERRDVPEIIDLAESGARFGSDLVYIEPDRLHHIDENRVLRYDLSMPLLHSVHFDGRPLRLLASGKVYRRETVSATHLEAFHQVEILAMDERSRLDGWTFAGGILRVVAAVLPGRAIRIAATTYPACSEAWQLDVDDDGQWTEILAWGEYADGIVRALGGDPSRHVAMGAGFGLERMACLRFGIDDIRKVAEMRVATG